MQIIDSLKSLVTGLGTSKDKTVSQVFGYKFVGPEELNAMHRSDWLARKVVDIIPNDMTREWRDWQAENDQIEKIEAVEKTFNVQGKVNLALQKDRLFGGAVIVIGIKGDDPAEELDLDRVKAGSLEYLHVLSRHDVAIGELIRDVTSPLYGEPTYYEVTSSQGNRAKVHPSRVVRFTGVRVLDDRTTMADGWGDSILQIVYDAVQNAASAQAHIAALIPEAKQDIIYIPGLSEYAATTAGQTKLTNRFTYANMAKSMFNMLLLDGTGQPGTGKEAGEKWEQKQINFANLPELMQQFLKIAAGAADITLIRLLQDAPSGLGSNGDSALQSYYDNVSARQRTELTPAMTRLDEVIIRSAVGRRDPAIYYDWSPLWSLSDKEKAEVFKMKADAARAIVGGNGQQPIIPPEALSDAFVNRLVEDGDLPGLEAAIEEFGRLADQEEEEIDLQAAVANNQQVAADAAPRTLYVRRDVLNADAIRKWAKAQGITDIEPDLHVTIIYSRRPMDWIKAGNVGEWNQDKNGQITIPAGGPRVVEPLGGMTAVLMFASSLLSWRHEEIVRAGASHDFPDYQPHISLTKASVELSKIEPYRGEIVLGPEIFEPLKED
ncbi:phage portal protein [Mesorhizobium sp. Z1-4]|uniref:anti-CBASS protein Acb1 family protein n=1 Tax=Mesorhizobium sp. Z1-4 TaxID=2448478 RepID=UPI000FDA8A98|nr:anti-CBASS Acb1 family protein [Mesorhizobium sp. Z1-4]